MHKILAAVAAALLAAGAAAYFWTRGGDAPAPLPADAVIAADAPLRFVPADTPFVFASLSGTPAELQQQWLRQYAAMAELYAQQFADLRLMFAEQMQSDPRVGALLDALEQEFVGRAPEDIAARLGIDTEARVAIYGIGLSPVLRLELADPQALAALVGRFEAAWGEALPQGRVDAQPYWTFGPAEAPLTAIMAIVERHLVITAAPRQADPAVLRELLGLTRPARSLADSGELQALNRRFGLLPYATGYLHSERLFDALHAPRGTAARAVHAALAIEPIAADPVCEAEWRALAQSWPQLVFGYTRLQAGMVDMRAVLEARADITAELRKLRAPIPGLTAIDGDVLAHLAVGLDLEALPGVVATFAERVAASPWQCPTLAPLNTQFAQAQRQIVNPMLYAVAPLASSLHMAITRVDVGAAEGPRGGGLVAIGSRNPAGLWAMGRGFVPGLQSADLPADGSPLRLPPIPGLPVDESLHVALADGALGIALGDAEARRLPAFLAIDPRTQPLLAGGVSSRMYLQIADQIEALTPAASPEVAERVRREAELMKQVYATLFERAGFSLELSDSGIELRQSAVLH